MSAPGRPKIGVLLVSSGWFRDVGLQDGESGITAEIGSAGAEIIRRVSQFASPICDGVVFSVDQARNAGSRIASERAEGLLIVPMVWCEDQVLRSALKELPDLPTILWVFTPYECLPDFVSFEHALTGSAPVAALQFSGMLKREGRRYRTVFGTHLDDAVYTALQDETQAMYIRRAIADVRIGVMPFRCDQMSTTYVDEFALRSMYGIELVYIELEEFKRTAQSVERARVDGFISSMGPMEVDVGHEDLLAGVRLALAMEEIVHREGLQVLAMNDVSEEMHASLGMRPCLWNPALSAAGCVVSMEAEVAAGIAMYILLLLTGSSPFYAEPLTIDIARNEILLGHAGYHDAGDRDPDVPMRIVADPEYANSDPRSGAVTLFKYRPGPVTLVNCVYTGDRLRMLSCSGESMPGPYRSEGNSHLICRLDMSLDQFFTAAVGLGSSQHWIVSRRVRGRQLDAVCRHLGLDYMNLDELTTGEPS